MKQVILTLAAILFYCGVTAQPKNATSIPTVYVDKSGVMRWEGTKEEASFYGVNYTVPFAHAYRALQYKGINHKEAIDRDVYHMSRLGFNAYRIHIWDVEISDGVGNLLANEHLDLLDYLFYKLEQNGIRILITTMTTFGNGYPERNINTGAFTYLYDKCNVHAIPAAIEAQKKYVTQLVNHKNPYTGKKYKDDPFVVGFEINNEPCHTGDIKITENYVKTMVKAFEDAGNKKPLFYNVSHNEDHVSAYYQKGIQGTTYQWYPIGLVAGHERKGNFLPYVDSYPIRFDQVVKDFDKKAKAVYEYDPADMLGSYLHPAITRTFKSSGFQWITQFAYDPIDIAQYNTEYQTHYLNLAYTPKKALSLMISAEVAYQIPKDKKFPAYPKDTVFDDFMVSYDQDLSVLNDGKHFYYTNNNSIKAKSNAQLHAVAGVGNSEVVKYSGSGAYFLDQLASGIWRLEVMPDVELISDPFSKPSLSKEVAYILWNANTMEINLADLGTNYAIESITNKDLQLKSSNNKVSGLKPGVYLLKSKDSEENSWNADSRFKYGKVKNYYAPKASEIINPTVLHTAPTTIERKSDQHLSFKILSNEKIDSVILQNNRVSFWNDKNPYVKLSATGNDYEAVLLESFLNNDELSYTITVFYDGKKMTYPDHKFGTPLDWDYDVQNYWTSKVVTAQAPIVLMDARNERSSSLSYYAIPDSSFVTVKKDEVDFQVPTAWEYTLVSKAVDTRFFLKKYVRELFAEREKGLVNSSSLKVLINNKKYKGAVQIGFVTKQGYTYVKELEIGKIDNNGEVVEVNFKDLKLVPTAILPSPYPAFLERYFVPQQEIPFDIGDVESFIMSTTSTLVGTEKIGVSAVWID